MQERIIQLVRDLVAFPTHETEGTAQAYLAEVLEGLGFRCVLQEIAPDRPNLIATRGSGGTFVCSHIDTHPPHAHPDPYEAKVRGSLLVGRGVLDAKGQIAALIAAAELAADAPVTIVITCDEEFTGLGSEHLDMPDGPWRTDGGIVLEPTGLRPCVAQGGHIDLTIGASAPATHAFAPASERSPIDIVLDAVEALRSIDAMVDRHPLLPAPRVHLGKIAGGEHLWRTPARADAEVTIGLVPPTTTAEVRTQIADALDAVATTWDAEGGSFLYDMHDDSPPIELPPSLPVLDRLRAAGVDAPDAGMNSWTDAGNLLVHHGTPCVVFGAGELTSAHSNHEWVEIADLVRLAEILASVLQN